MRRCSSVLILTLVMTHAEAQVLDLDPPAPDAPPALGLDTAAADRIRVLLPEAAALEARVEDLESILGQVTLASVNMRRIAAELLDVGDRQGSAGSSAVLAGVRLFRGRETIDEILARLVSRPLPTDLEPAVDAVRRFNELTAARLAESPAFPAAPPALDTAVASLMRPLADAVERLGDQTTVNQWISGGDPSAAGGRPLEPMIALLAQRIEAAGLDEPTRQTLTRTAAFLERGAAFETFRPQVESYGRLLIEVLELAEVVRVTAWITDDQRAVCRNRIDAAVTLFADRMTRADGERRLHRLADSRRIVDRISKLYETDLAPAPGRGRADATRFDLEPVQRAFAAVVTAADTLPEGLDRDPQIDRMLGILDGMIAYRELGRPALTHELRVVWRKLHDAYARTEREILDHLPRLTGRALSDPALASLVVDQRQYVEDLQRLEKLPAWVDAVRRIAPRAAGPFGGRTRSLTTRLADPSRRHDAVQRLDELERQLAAFEAMPFEAELRGSDRAAIVATGGLHERLAAEIDQQRRRWAEAWSAGDEAGPRVVLLHELLQIMDGTAELLRLGDQAAVVNRWSAWELEEATIGRLVTDLKNRLKLATTAALENDEPGLRDQLDRLQAPPAVLLARLAARLEAPLAPMPTGAVSIMGQCVHPPPPGAWMLAGRRDIADFCRYTMELEYARATGRSELAAGLDGHVNRLADQLLKEIPP